MMNGLTEIQLYGSKSCHKTVAYRTFLDSLKLSYQFLDVANDECNANKLRELYENRKLNFPTITIGEKKLRNPSLKDLNKWIEKLI